MNKQLEYILNDSFLSDYDSFNLNNFDNNTKSKIEATRVILKIFRPINLFATLLLSAFGLTGHCLTILIYSRKKFRTNSSHVYLFSLAIKDALFIIFHLLEDTIRTWQDTFMNETVLDDDDLEYLKQQISFIIVSFLNITDRFDVACRLVNFTRYVLRFISAFIIVAFTIQRLSIIISPECKTFKSKKSAWATVFSICLVSLVINLWVPFFFKLKSNENNIYCDVQDSLERAYFFITLIYIGLIMFSPILIIFISNSLIIYFSIETYKKNLSIRDHTTLVSCQRSYKTFESTIKEKTNRKNFSSKITRMLLLISFSYALLNLPYFITWCLFFVRKNDTVVKNNFFAALQISEIFYILNYCIYFYINFASGSLFRHQLYFICKFTFKCLFNIFFIIISLF